MLRGIVCYFLLVFCLLTKDGISLAFDVMVEKNPISLEMNFEDSFEEDGCNDFFANEDFGSDLDQNNIDGFADKSINDQYKLSTLHLLLEQESPPPRTA